MADLIVHTLPVGPIQGNCYVVGSSRSGKGIVIDPGAEPERVMTVVRESGLEIVAVVNTHAHFDHAGANRQVRDATGAPLMVHRDDAPSLGRLSAQARFFMMRSDDSPPADRLLEEGDEIDLGDVQLMVLHTPGHTAGGISLAGPGVVFTGDSLFAGSVGRTDLPGCSHERLLAGIHANILSLPDATVVYPGHGPTTTVGEERTTNPFLT